MITYRGGWLGVVGSHEVAGKHMLCSNNFFKDPLVLELAQKVVKSVDNITTRSCELNTNRAFMDI